MARPGEMQRAQQKFIVFEQFAKLNTQSVRQALKEGELAWLENLQPIAPNNLAAVPGPARTPLATLVENASVMFYAYLNGVDYLIVFTTAGAGFAVNIATGAISGFAPDGTFSSNPDVTTWQGTRLLIADPIAGDATWDGNLYVQTGGVSPNITITNGGSGYSPTSPPTVTITGGSGTGATAHAVVAPNGVIVQVVLDSPGIGYLPTDTLFVNFGTSPGSGAAAHVTMTGYPVSAITSTQNSTTHPPANYALVFSGGGGTGAEGYGHVVAGSPGNTITWILVSGGSGYTSSPSVSCPSLGFSAGGFTAHLGTQSVATIVLTAGGTGYTSPPAVTITPPDGVGSGATAVTTLSGTSVNTISLSASVVDTLTIANEGSYTNVPGTYALTFTGGGGVGAAGTATLTSITDPVTGLPRTVISAVNITSGGANYVTAPTVAITGGTGTLGSIIAHITSQGGGYDATPNVFIGAGSGAAASAHVWPFTVSSNPAYAWTTIAVFQGRVWLGGGPILQWTGTGASYGNVGYDDFLAADASGALIISDADLIHAITALRAANNYLYILGDQSVKQIGNISIGSGSVTLFTILTLSSDQGTIYKQSCGSFNRVFMFANSNGIYAVFGSSVQKISDDLDGIFKLIDFSQPPQAALADIRNIHNISFLVRYIDPLSTTRSLLLLFNGKQWFLANQGNSLKTIAATAALATGKTTLYGSSGTDLTALFNDATVAVPFKWQSALTHHGNAVQRKKIIRAGFAVTMGANGQLSMSVDTDEASNVYTETVHSGFRALSFQTDNMGRFIDGAGRYLGLTITGTLANFIGSAMTLEYQDTNLGNRNTP